MKYLKRRGEVNIIGLLAIGVTIAISSIGGFFYQSNRTGSLETRTALLEYQFTKIDKQYEEMNRKLDDILSGRLLVLGSATTTQKINGHR